MCICIYVCVYVCMYIPSSAVCACYTANAMHNSLFELNHYAHHHSLVNVI